MYFETLRDRRRPTEEEIVVLENSHDRSVNAFFGLAAKRPASRTFDTASPRLSKQALTLLKYDQNIC